MFSKNLLVYTIRHILFFLPKHLLKKGIVVVILTIFNSIIDLLGLAAVLPLFALILSADNQESNEYIQVIRSYFNDTPTFIITVSCTLVVLLIAKNIVGHLINIIQSRFTWRVYRFLVNTSVLHFIHAGHETINKKNSNVILNQISGAPMMFTNQLLEPLVKLINEFFILFLTILSLMIYDIKIILILCITIVPVFILFNLITKRKTQRVGNEMLQINPKINKSIFNIIFGFKDLQVTNTANYFTQRVTTVTRRMEELYVYRSLIAQLPSRILELSAICTVLIIIIYGLSEDDQSKNLTLLSVFGLAAFKLIPAFNRLTLHMMSIRGGQKSIEFLSEIDFSKKYETSIATNPDQVPSFRNIILDQLSFRYDQDYVFKDLNFEIKKGDCIGLVGKSGTGKSTLINLILGFLTPSDGQILYNDHHKLDVNFLTQKIGYVPQEVFLFDASIAENIAFGTEIENIDYERVNEALIQASLWEDVNQLSDGVHTNLTERGSNLSGGQKQRLGIARSLYRNAEIIIMDEATSALDTDTQNQIIKTLDSLKQNYTLLLISHREELLQVCNKVYTINNKTLVSY